MAPVAAAVEIRTRLARAVSSVAGRTLFSSLTPSQPPSSARSLSSIPSTIGCRDGSGTSTITSANSTALFDLGFRRQFHSTTPSLFSASGSAQVFSELLLLL